VPFRASFDCLWCGRPHTVRDAADVEGWAQLCPDCVGRAGENGFLRFRLKSALAERAKASRPPETTGAAPEPRAAAPDRDAPVDPDSLDQEMVAYYDARASEYDDRYRRRGRYSHGPIHDMAWQVDLDVVTRWLDAQPIRGEIVEMAAGTGWWSPLLAQKGELWAYDAAGAPLDLARDRLLAHGLRAHLHVRDAWAEPDRQVDVVFAAFWLGHVPRERLPAFLALVRRWLRPGGSFVVVDALPDPQSGAAGGERMAIAPDVELRRLADGRQFRVVKVHWTPDELATALRAAGFEPADVGTTSRFFLFARAVAA